MPNLQSAPDRLAYRPAEAAHACGVSRATFYDWMSRGLAPRPIQTPGGGATLILASALKSWLEESQKAGPVTHPRRIRGALTTPRSGRRFGGTKKKSRRRNSPSK